MPSGKIGRHVNSYNKSISRLRVVEPLRHIRDYLDVNLEAVKESVGQASEYMPRRSSVDVTNDAT